MKYWFGHKCRPNLAIRDEVVEGSMEVVKTDLETENSTTTARTRIDIGASSIVRFQGTTNVTEAVRACHSVIEIISI